MNRFKKELLAFAVATGQELTETRLDALCAFVKDYDETALIAALHQHSRSSQWIPAPAELIKYIEGDPAERAPEAWGEVYEAVRRVGSYGTPVFDDPAIATAISYMGGWVHLCGMQESEVPFRQKEFCEAYQSATGAEQREIMGRIEADKQKSQLSGGLRKLMEGSEHGSE